MELEIVSVRLLTVIFEPLKVTLPTGVDVAALKVVEGQRYNVPLAKCDWLVLEVVQPMLNCENVMLPPLTVALNPINTTCDWPEVIGVEAGCKPPVNAAKDAD